MKYSKIIGTGSYLPEKILTNHDLEKIVDTKHDWIVERTGIKQRHIVGEGETSSTMAEQAARNALASANIQAEDLGLIIVASTTPDVVMPSTACFLQSHLGVPGIPAFDISAACAGFIYAMSIADQFIRTGTIKNALIVGAETMSSIIDWNDRRTCVLFGDGAGAVVLQASDQPGVLSTHIHADGNYKDLLYVPSSLPGQANISEPSYVQMSGNEVFKFAVKILGKMVTETLDANNINKEDIDWLIPHQANLRIINATAKKLDLSMEQVVVTVGEHGNTSAASIPLALDQAVRDGRVKPGHKLLLEAIGGGFTWGSALIDF